VESGIPYTWAISLLLTSYLSTSLMTFSAPAVV
jgi:hypothetical protein